MITYDILILEHDAEHRKDPVQEIIPQVNEDQLIVLERVFEKYNIRHDKIIIKDGEYYE